ncbi:unnamed protein product [Parajaminaea phylloscopi]
MNSQYVLGRRDDLEEAGDSSRSFTSSLPAHQCHTFEELRAHLQMHARKQGFACVTRVSHLKRENPDCTFQCDSGGAVRNNWGVTCENRRRRTPSGRINCPFRVKAYTVFCEQDDVAMWTFKVLNPSHNHSPASITLPHPIHRRFTDEELDFLRSQQWSKTTRRAIVDKFRHTDPTHPATRTDVGNAIAKMRREELSPLPAVPAALRWLDAHKTDWRFQAHADAYDRLDRLVFMNQEMLVAVKRWGSVLQMDCTYSTNKYRLPLLHVCGVTATGRTFTAGYALLAKEDSISYEWALRAFQVVGAWPTPAVIVTDRDLALMNAIKQVFPESRNLLCRWHIGRAVKAKITEHFSKSKDLEDADAVDQAIEEFSRQWEQVFHAKTERELTEAWDAFVELCTMPDSWTPATRVYDYIVETWMRHQQSFMLPYIDRVRHLGCRTTSRCEGNHARMKKQLVTRNSKLHVLLGTLAQHQMHEQRENLDSIAKDRNKAMGHLMEDDFFARVVRKVSHFALGKLEDEWRKRGDPAHWSNRNCECNFTVSWGIPCIHRIKYAMLNKQILQLDQFAAHWHLDRPQEILCGGSADEHAPPASLPPLSDLPYTQNEVDDLLLAPRVRRRGFQPSRRSRAASGRILNSFSQTIDRAVREGRSNIDHTGKKVRRCGICKRPGHDRRRCDSELEAVDEEQWDDAELMTQSLNRTEMTPMNSHMSSIAMEYPYGATCLVAESFQPSQSQQYTQSVFDPPSLFVPSSFPGAM